MTLTHTKDTTWAGSSGDKTEQGTDGFGAPGRRAHEPTGHDGGHFPRLRQNLLRCRGRQPGAGDCLALFLPRPVQRAAQHDGRHDARPGQKRRGDGHQFLFDGIPRSGLRRRLPQDRAQMDAAVKAERERQGQGRQAPELLRGSRKSSRKFDAELPLPSYTRIADHIDHAVKVGGDRSRRPGIRLRWIDGFVPRGMEDCSKIPGFGPRARAPRLQRGRY